MTSYADIPKAVHAVKSGAFDFIEKPFSLDVLEHMINSKVFEKLDKININQEEKDISRKLSEITNVLQNEI